MNFLSKVAHWFFTASHWRGTDGIPHRVYEHLTISGLAVAAALLVALPIALWLGHLGKGGYAAISIANAGRAIPSFALLVIGFEIFGLGATPVFLALFALSVPPIVTNTYTAIRGVDPDVKESAVGMGMTGWQVLTRVEIPNAIPLMFAGIRTAGVQAVATATLGAVVAWGGVGRYIVDGIAQQDHVLVFAGALIVAVLSFLTELALAALQRGVTPKGLRLSAAHDPKLSTLPGAAATTAGPAATLPGPAATTAGPAAMAAVPAPAG
ncbi:MAG: osmoprotectant transport system permease protein [Acidimicrobiaceae bacterium]|nr:osmoprotectant transport system permease protein [Acidimicrobiaceae bacterium]